MPTGPAAATEVWAHRGRGAPVSPENPAAPENTAAAFAGAGRLGVDGVELDVRLSADGVLVVHHDPESPGLGPVSALRVEELPSPVTLLADALDACAGLVVDIEIKNAPTEPGFDPAERAARALPAAIAAARSLRGVVVSSFATASLDAARDAARARGDELRLGWLVAPDVNPSTVVEETAARGYQCLHPFVSWVDPALVQRARRHLLALHVWTVNAADDLTSMFDLGVDALITDRPAEALALRRSRRDAS